MLDWMSTTKEEVKRIAVIEANRVASDALKTMTESVREDVSRMQ